MGIQILNENNFILNGFISSVNPTFSMKKPEQIELHSEFGLSVPRIIKCSKNILKNSGNNWTSLRLQLPGSRIMVCPKP